MRLLGKHTRRILCVCMILCLAAAVFSAQASGTVDIVGAPVEGLAGETVDVVLTLSGNEGGVVGGRITVAYDPALTLNAVTNGTALAGLSFTPPGRLTDNPVNLLWTGLDAVKTNGTLVTLNFTIPAGAEPGTTYTVALSCQSEDFCDNDLNDVAVTMTDAVITVHGHTWNGGDVTTAPTCTAPGVMTYTCSGCGQTRTEPIAALGHDLVHHDGKQPTDTEVGWTAYDTCSRCDYTTYEELPKLHRPGDVNGDGKLNARDVVMLQRFVAGGYGVTIEGDWADVDHNGKVNARDVVLLQRFIAGGYGVTLV